MLASRFVPLLVRLIAPLGALWIEGPSAAVGTILIQEAGLWLARRLGGQTGARLFLAAYVLRIVLIYPSHVVARLGNGNGALFQDDYTYDLVGEWLARIARGDGLTIFAGHQYLLYGVYDYLLMAMYVVFGHTPLLPKVLNGALAALCAVLLMEIARTAFRPSVAVLAGIAATLLPTMVIWSIVTLKEIPVLFVALLGLRALQVLVEVPLRSRAAADALVILAAAVAVSFDLRSSTAAILIGLLLLILLVRAPLALRRWQLGVSALALLVILVGGLFAFRGYASARPPAGVLEDVVLQIRHRRAQEAAAARSQIRSQADVFTAEGGEIVAAEAASDATPFSLVGDVIEPLGYALLAPAPWQVHSLRDLAATGEMLIWYPLLGLGLLAWRAGPRPGRGQRLFLVCLVLYGLANWLVLAASEGNLGNLARHRLMLTPTLLVLSSAGLVWLWPRLGRGEWSRGRVVEWSSGSRAACGWRRPRRAQPASMRAQPRSTRAQRASTGAQRPLTRPERPTTASRSERHDHRACRRLHHPGAGRRGAAPAGQRLPGDRPGGSARGLRQQRQSLRAGLGPAGRPARRPAARVRPVPGPDHRQPGHSGQLPAVPRGRWRTPRPRLALDGTRRAALVGYPRHPEVG